MILLVVALVVATLLTGAHIVIRFYSYYLVDGIGKVLEAIEQPNVADEEDSV